MNRTTENPTTAGRMAGDSGASLVEYTLLISLIALVALAALTAFGDANRGSVDDSASKIIAAGGP